MYYQALISLKSSKISPNLCSAHNCYFKLFPLLLTFVKSLDPDQDPPPEKSQKYRVF